MPLEKPQAYAPLSGSKCRCAPWGYFPGNTHSIGLSDRRGGETQHTKGLREEYQPRKSNNLVLIEWFIYMGLRFNPLIAHF